MRWARLKRGAPDGPPGPWVLLAAWGPCGFSPLAPGTVGTLGAIPLFWLLRDLPLIGKIFETVRAAVKIPFTVKFRAGWSEKELVFLELAKLAESCGLNAMAMHAMHNFLPTFFGNEGLVLMLLVSPRLSLVGLSVLLAANMVSLRPGRAMRALHGSQLGAQACGVDLVGVDRICRWSPSRISFWTLALTPGSRTATFSF